MTPQTKKIFDLNQKDLRPAAIAKEVGLTRQRVSSILGKLARDGHPVKRTARAEYIARNIYFPASVYDEIIAEAKWRGITFSAVVRERVQKEPNE